MSAAPLPTPDPEPAPPYGDPRREETPALRTPEPAATDADGWALLEALRRRLDDQSAQGRKTQLHVTQLADSIGALVESQRRTVGAMTQVDCTQAEQRDQRQEFAEGHIKAVQITKHFQV